MRTLSLDKELWRSARAFGDDVPTPSYSHIEAAMRHLSIWHDLTFCSSSPTSGDSVKALRKQYAVDLDGTLAIYQGHASYDPASIGAPIVPMLLRVKQWLEQGHDVVIFTARVWHDGTPERLFQAGTAHKAITEWCEEHIGRRLEITCEKSPWITTIFDDRAVQVLLNTGLLVDGETLRDALHALNNLKQVNLLQADLIHDQAGVLVATAGAGK